MDFVPDERRERIERQELYLLGDVYNQSSSSSLAELKNLRHSQLAEDNTTQMEILQSHEN